MRADGVILPLALDRQPLPAGWLAVHISGSTPATSGPLRLILYVEPARAFPIEFEIEGVPECGTAARILHIEQPVFAAEMLVATETAAKASLAVRLERLGRLRLCTLALRRDPGEALRALRWRVQGKAVRARNILRRLFGRPRWMAYAAWLARNAPVWAAEVLDLKRQSRSWNVPPRIGIVLPPGLSETIRGQIVQSLDGQIYLAAGIATTIEALAETDWIVNLRTPHLQHPDALLRIAAAVQANGDLRTVTWDSDSRRDDGVRHSPELKPHWNRELYLANDYVGPFAVRRDLLGASGLDASMPDALLLQAAEPAASAHHIARILSSRLPASSEQLARCSDAAARRDAIAAVLASTEQGSEVTLETNGLLRIRRPLPTTPPLVSLVVPTRDRLDLLKPCIESLRSSTDYPAIEILIADNGSIQPATLRYFEHLAADPRVRVIACPGPFNFAAINNGAVAAARGAVLGFINNDIEVMASGWLTDMAGHALLPHVGAVGAKLLYPGGRVQHAGVILGVGGYAGHAHRFADPDDRGYLGRLQCQQYFSAVTAACLVVERHKFEAVGGFDADAFPVAYNDVDLCLRLNAFGWSTLWTPYAVLLHKESASRARDYSPERLSAYQAECQAFIDRWGAIVANDPFYSPHLTRKDESFSLD